MKNFAILLALIFVTSTLALNQNVWTTNGDLNVATKKCARLTRPAIEEKFGKPIKCATDAKDVECLGHEREPMKVHFNSSDVLVSIEMSTSCNGLQSLTKVLDEMVPKNARGKYVQELKKSPSGSCQVVSEEEYECVTIKYFQELCMGCSPASLRIVWKS